MEPPLLAPSSGWTCSETEQCAFQKMTDNFLLIPVCAWFQEIWFISLLTSGRKGRQENLNQNLHIYRECEVQLPTGEFDLFCLTKAQPHSICIPIKGLYENDWGAKLGLNHKVFVFFSPFLFTSYPISQNNMTHWIGPGYFSISDLKCTKHFRWRAHLTLLWLCCCSNAQ